MILNTQQIILLCLLVSFVTSIATGITVISLMQQSPEPVTQTINRVIERTVETVTQQPIEDIKNIISQNPSQPSKEVVTVVVNQEDQSINAVAKNESSIARIHLNNRTEDFVTMGIVLNQAGDIVVDKRMIDKKAKFTAYYGTRKFNVQFQPGTEKTDFVTLKIIGTSTNDFIPASFGDSNSLKLAQSVISLSGAGQTSVSTGEIVSFAKLADGSVGSIKTSVNAQNVLTGSVLLNLTGSIIGIKIATIEDQTVFMPVNNLKAQIFVP